MSDIINENVLINGKRVDATDDFIEANSQAPLNVVLFEATKYNTKLKAQAYGDVIISTILSGVSEQRQKAWPTKGRIAASIIKDNAIAAEVATVQAECDERGDGLTVEEMAAIHLAKSVALLTANNIIEGMIFKVNNAIDGAETPEALALVVTTFTEEADIKKAEMLSTFNS